MSEYRLPDVQMERRHDPEGPPWWGYDPVTEYTVTGDREDVEQMLHAVRQAWLQGYAQGRADT